VDQGNWDTHNDFCNIYVDLPDGRHYGINVWTFEYFQTSIIKDRKDGKKLNGIYQVPPDLFIRELTRDCIEKTISDFLDIDDFEKVSNPSVFSKADQPNELHTA
jgi:hypothetical protein